METKEIVAIPQNTAPAVMPFQSFSDSQIQLIKKTIAKNATDDEFAFFLTTCQMYKLNPFMRQIYYLKFGDVPQICISIDGLRKRAEDTGRYAGQTTTFWCGENGKWVDVWTSEKLPLASRVGVYKQGIPEPFFGVAHMKEFSQGSKMWQKIPCHMLAKCAEALALRKAFPSELGGIYTKEEMESIDKENMCIEIPMTEPKPMETAIHTALPNGDNLDSYLPESLRGNGMTLEKLASDKITYKSKINGTTSNGWFLLKCLSEAQHVPQNIQEQAKKILETRPDKTIDIPV